MDVFIITDLTSPTQDLCYAALSFASDTLKADGNFVCKFYQGKEDKALETKLKQMFRRVCREKPESSRSVSAVLVPAGITLSAARGARSGY